MNELDNLNQLELVEIEHIKTNHEKIMDLYRSINNKLDRILERKTKKL